MSHLDLVQNNGSNNALGFFINYAASVHMAPTRAQYRLVQAIPLIPVGLSFILSFLLDDSPRWLASKNRYLEAKVALARLRGQSLDDPCLTEEFNKIDRKILARKQNLEEASVGTIVKEIATIPSYRRRYLLVVTMQALAQWTGGNGITYYIPEIFKSAGVSDSNSLISSGAYGIVKLVFTMIFTWFMIDMFGRRPCFLTGLAMQLAAHVYLAVFTSHPNAIHNKSASDAAIASVFVYAIGWSIGLCTIQYLYGTEVYPTRIRSFGYASSMALHWFFQFAVVRVTPNLFVSLHTYGAYVFWAMICFQGIVVLGLWAPETKGIPMERMGELFEGPWYLGWKAKVDLTNLDHRSHSSSPERQKDFSIPHVESAR